MSIASWLVSRAERIPTVRRGPAADGIGATRLPLPTIQDGTMLDGRGALRLALADPDRFFAKSKFASDSPASRTRPPFGVGPGAVTEQTGPLRSDDQPPVWENDQGSQTGDRPLVN
jgi:hypothetical protein